MKLPLVRALLISVCCALDWDEGYLYWATLVLLREDDLDLRDPLEGDLPRRTDDGSDHDVDRAILFRRVTEAGCGKECSLLCLDKDRSREEDRSSRDDGDDDVLLPWCVDEEDKGTAILSRIASC